MVDHFWERLAHLARPLGRGDYDGTDEGEQRISAGAWMDALTKRLAALSRHEREEFGQLCEKHEAELAMCLVPASVVLSWLGPDQRREEFRFSTLDTPLGELFPSAAGRIAAPRRRVTAFPLAILVVAAELAADTRRRRAGELPFPPSGQSPENESAPDRQGSGAPTLTKQPRELRAAGTLLPNPETKRVCANYQAHTGSRGPFPLLEEPRSYATRP